MKRIGQWSVFLGAVALAFWLLWVGGTLTKDRATDSVPVWPKPGTPEWKNLERLKLARLEAERRAAYRMNWPLEHQIALDIDWPFRVLVMGSSTEFRKSVPREQPPPEGWFVYVTVGYRPPEAPIDPTWQPRIDEADPQPLRIARGDDPHADELVLTSVTFPDGEHLRFNCYGANHLRDFQEATTAAQLAEIEWPGLCRGFMSLRPGVDLMVQFPIDKADVAHRGLTQAIALMDRSIVEQTPSLIRKYTQNDQRLYFSRPMSRFTSPHPRRYQSEHSPS